MFREMRVRTEDTKINLMKNPPVLEPEEFVIATIEFCGINFKYLLIFSNNRVRSDNAQD